LQAAEAKEDGARVLVDEANGETRDEREEDDQQEHRQRDHNVVATCLLNMQMPVMPNLTTEGKKAEEE